MIAQELRTAVDLLAKGLESIHAAKSYTIAVKKLEDLARTFILLDDWLNLALEALFSLRALDEASLPFSLPIFIMQATEALDGLREPTGKKFPDNLIMLPLASARGLRFDVVFIPGCVEGQIPFVGRQDPILLDHERKRLNELDSSRELPLFSDRQNNERNLFDLACQSATKQIVFSFPRIDLATERQRMPSHYLFGLFGEALTEEAFYKRSDIVKRFDANRLCPDIPNDALSGDEKLLSWMNQLEKSHPFSSVHFLKLCSQSFGQAWQIGRASCRERV